MKSAMVYKGYLGKAWPDTEAKVFRGEVVNIRDTITFQSPTFDGLVQEFHDSVDEYLEFCESRGESPDKPFSGRLPIRLSPDVHRTLTVIAKCKNISVNALVTRHLSKLARKHDRQLSGTGQSGQVGAVSKSGKVKSAKSVRAKPSHPTASEK